VLTEVEQFTAQMLAAGTVELVMSLSTMLGAGRGHDLDHR
jgi:hypothetical protein